MKYLSFENEVKFQVGQRVEMDLPEIPIEERDVTTGIIIKIYTKFFASPELRRVFYLVRFDNRSNYVKKEFRYCGGFTELAVEAGDLKLIK